MIDFDGYADGREGASHALVGSLAATLAAADSDPMHEGDGYVVLRDGRVISWEDRLDRPTRRRGNVTLHDPESFVAYLDRFGTEDTMIYASLAGAKLTAVLNDHPEVRGDDGTGVAGFRDDIAIMQLRIAEDFARIVQNNDKLLPQRTFAELMEELAHAVSTPDSATMLEVASTLNVKQNIDFGSRVRTQSGDVEFRFEQTSEARAGRDVRIEIPTTIAFTTPLWVGTEPVEITARLRFRASGDGCVMGYKLIQQETVMEKAFRDIVVALNGLVDAPDILFGEPFPHTSRY